MHLFLILEELLHSNKRLPMWFGIRRKNNSGATGQVPFVLSLILEGKHHP